MDFYPKGFPQEAQNNVEAESILASRDFDSARQELIESKNSEYGLADKVREHLADCVLRVWSSFAHEACELGRKNVWNVVDIDKYVRKFQEHLIHHFQAEKGYDTRDNSVGNLWVTVHRKMLDPKCAVRLKYEDDRLQVAQQKLPVESEVGTTVQVATVLFPNRSKWLANRLKERGWDKNHTWGRGGPERKTVQRILDGLAVHEGTLEKIIVALNKKKIGSPVSLMDIPSD